jgi:hypothetical protein
MPRRPRVAAAAAPVPAPWQLAASSHPQQHKQQQQQQFAKSPVSCAAAVSGWRALDSGEDSADPGSGAAAALDQSPPLLDVPSSKFDRIMRFVDQHDLAGTCSAASSTPGLEVAADGSGEWHHSYDEEAEEGCEDDAASAVGPHEARQLVAAAEALIAGPACSVAFLYPAQQQFAASAAAAYLPGAVGTPAYFAAKPLDLSYDEEAEGCYEAAAAEAVVEAAVARAARFASLIERRAETRAAARARRAGLVRAVGDLEGGMQPWVDELAARKAADAVKRAAGRVPPGAYPHLAAFLASRTGGALGAVESVFEALQRERGLQARAPQAWQYTWDEEAHGALSSM